MTGCWEGPRRISISSFRPGLLSCCRVLLSELGGGALVPLGDPEDDTARVVWNGLTIDISGFRGGALNIEDDLRLP